LIIKTAFGLQLSAFSKGRRTVALTAGAMALLVMLCHAPAGAESFVDAVGREVEVKGVPVRIVSLAPNLTEILFALGLGEQVAGVTTFCDWPEEAKEKPRVGGFINPSLEAIVALDPDLVVATADGNRRRDVEALETLGLAVFVVDTKSFGEIEETILTVGRVTGQEKEALALTEEMSRRLRHVRESVGDRPLTTVFVALDRNPLITAGKGTFVDELVTLAGGRNIVADSPVKYPVYSMEQLLAADPEVIVGAAGRPAESQGEAAARWRELPGGSGLGAVREEKVYELGEGDFFRPGPRIIGSLEKMAGILHPEVFRR
jgi:iron complex transport system substrate-binding protein